MNNELTKLQQRVIDFLSIETFTTPTIIQCVLQQTTIQSAHQILKRMVQKRLIKCETIPILSGRAVKLYGITEHGLAHVTDVHKQNRPTFQKSKVSTFTLQHKLDIQKFHILTLQNGWTNWRDGSQIGKRDKHQKIPDAVSKSPYNKNVAFEIEREIKSLKRYREILTSHLISRKNGEWDEVIYLCPTPKMAKSLNNKIRSIKSVNHLGHSIQLTEKHFDMFRFYSYDNFIETLK